MLLILETPFHDQERREYLMATKKHISCPRTVAVRGVWHDHFANHWYEYPRRVAARAPQVPSIWLRGHWITAAGFSLDEKVAVVVSEELIVLRLIKKG